MLTSSLDMFGADAVLPMGDYEPEKSDNGAERTGKDKSEIKGSLRCGGKRAAFGRDDVRFVARLKELEATKSLQQLMSSLLDRPPFLIQEECPDHSIYLLMRRLMLDVIF